MEQYCRYLYFTKTHGSYGLTVHICTRRDYPENHPEHPEISVVEFPSKNMLNKYIESAKNAGLHVCHCDEA